MSEKKKIPVANARKIAEMLAVWLSPACERVSLAGSLRRGAAVVGDIELVVIPEYETQGLFAHQRVSRLEPLLDAMIAGGRLETLRRGPKAGCYMVTAARPPVQLDLFIANHDNWGMQVAIRTGPAPFSKKIVTPRQRGGLLHNDYRVHGGFVWRTFEQKVPGLSSKHAPGDVVCELEGTPYIKHPVGAEEDFFSLLTCGWVDPKDRRG